MNKKTIINISDNLSKVTVVRDLLSNRALFLSITALIACLAIFLPSRMLVKAKVTEGRLQVTSAAYNSRSTPLAPDSLAAAYGTNLATGTAVAEYPLPTQLAGTTVVVSGRAAQLLYVSPTQLNFVIPAGLEPGRATVVVTAADGSVAASEIVIAPVAPALFAADGSGANAPAGALYRYRNGGLAGKQDLFEAARPTEPAIIEPGAAGDDLYLVVYGTGIRGQGDVTKIRALIGGLEAPVDFAGGQAGYAGMDQVNIRLPQPLVAQLSGRGKVQLTLVIDGAIVSNSLTINIGAGGGPLVAAVSSPGVVPALAGTAIGIRGRGFGSRAEDIRVSIGGVEATVERVAATELIVRIPYGAATGRLTVRTPRGESVSREAVKIQTSLSGLVESTERLKIEGMAVDLYDRSAADGARPLSSARTDEQGRFILAVPEAGDYLVVFNDSSTRLPYPTLSSRVRVEAGKDNQLERIALQQVGRAAHRFDGRAENGLLSLVSEAGLGRTIRLEEPGIRFELPGQAVVTTPGGEPAGEITLTRVRNSLPPASLPAGHFSAVMAQITSFGARLEPGGRLTFRNEDGYQPGEKVDLYRLEQNRESQDFGRFVKVEGGTATVSEDGQSISTPENAIREATIYFVSNPRQRTTLVGQVLIAEGDQPARPLPYVRVAARGQQALTDGNGSFVLRDLPAGEEALTVEAFYVQPDGSVARTEHGGIRAVTSGMTTLGDPIILHAVASNRAPVIVFSPLNMRVNAHETTTHEFICFDPDGTAVRPTLTALDGQPVDWISIAERGNGRWALVINAPANLAGSTRQFIIAARDAESAAATVSVVLKINGRPVATRPANDLLTEQKTPLNILLGAVDPDNDPLTYLIASYPTNGELDLSQLPQLKYTPVDGWSGVDKITFRVSDGLVESEPVDLFVITLPNGAPSLVVPAAQVVNAGQLVRFNVTASDSAAGQRLALEMLSIPGAGARFDAATGAFEWRPTGTQTGRYQVRFKVSDNGSPVLTDEKTVEITVVNRAPVISVPGPQTGVAGERMAFAVGGSDEDDGQALTIRATNLPAGATYSNGQFDWTPAAGQAGSYQLSFLVSDNGSPVRTATGVVSVRVNAPPSPNRPPVIATPGAVTVIGGELLTFAVTASDPDSGQSLIITNSNLPTGAVFTQSTATGGQFTWTPTAAQVGVYTIAFSVTDNGSPALSETRTVTITVLQPNRTPVLTLPGTQTALVGEQLTFQVTATDPDAGQRVTITTVTANLPRGATFVATPGATGSGQFRWKPTTAQIGTYYISFTATDNGVPTSSANDIVIIKVTPAYTTSTFTTATVNSNGVVTRIPGRQVQQYEEDLGNGAKMEMVVIPGGSFMMGSPDNEAGRFPDEGPQRQVTINEFVMGKYEVTQGQWRAVTGSNPSSFAGDSFPVERVSWNEAKEFCRLLNQKLGLNEINGYRLPSEAEWEYAARAGTTTQFAFGVTISTEIANYYGASRYGNSQFGVYRDRAVRVGSLGVANGWGLFDMHGNVSEWCEDDYHNSYGRPGAPVNGTPWVDSPRAAFRMFRGGGWVDHAVFLRAADRRSYLPGYRTDGLGFRLVRTLP